MLDTKKVGIKIASLRKSFGYSQEKLAEILGVSPQAISKWENGHALPDTSMLPVLAQIFGCSIDSILMPAYSYDEKIEEERPNVLEQQAEHIAKYVIKQMEDKLVKKETVGFTDEIIAEAVIEKHSGIGSITISRGKESRTTGEICTSITITAPQKEIKLIETIYHKRTEKFYGYALLSEYISEIPQIYCIDHDKKAILLEALSENYIKGFDFNEDNENGEIIRDNYKNILHSAVNFHNAFWENRSAFERIGLLWHFEVKENMLAWIYDAMEKPFNKYRKDEETGKIPKDGGICGKNNITKKQLDYYDEALQYLKTEYPKLIESRYHAGKNITVIHGDLHPGNTMMSKNSDRQVKFIDPQAVRIGLGTEDLAMLIALHISCDSSAPDAAVFNDTQPWLDYYYQRLSEKVKDYSYETFMNDYKISVAENLFFPIRLINHRGVFDFRMRDRAIHAFKTFVLEI